MPRVYPARTVLAQRIRDRRLTLEEFCEQLEVFARENNKVGTVSIRHVQRLAAGQCTSDQLRPATAHLLERYFESPIEELLVSPETKDLSAQRSDLLAQTDQPDCAASARGGVLIDPFDGAPVGADYVENLHGTIKHLVALDGVHGGGNVAPIALCSFNRAQLILREGRYQPAFERDLEAVTAEIGELSGWLLFDAERLEESRRVNTQALTLARIAGEVSMEWFVLSNQALASVHTGRNREALRIARGMLGGQDLPRRVRALFDVRAARALAALGDPSAVRAFDRARSAFAEGTTTRDPTWSWWFDERELAGHEGMIHAALGDYSRALPKLATAVELSQGREHFRWALYIHRANLLRTLLRANSWAEAEQVARDIVPMVGMIASARTEGLLRHIVTRLEARPQMPSTLSDILDCISNQLAER